MLEISGETLALILMPAQTIGALMAAFLAYFIPKWTQLHWMTFGLGLFWTLPLSGFIAESPPWLIVKKRYEEARTIVKYGAKRNGREIKVQILHPDKKSGKEVSSSSTKRILSSLTDFTQKNFKSANRTCYWKKDVSIFVALLFKVSEEEAGEFALTHSHTQETSNFYNVRWKLCFNLIVVLQGAHVG